MAAQSPEIAFHFMPGYAAFCAANLIQIKHATQHRMGTPKAIYNDAMPVHHQPWGYQTLRIHTKASTIKATLACLPTCKPQK